MSDISPQIINENILESLAQLAAHLKQLEGSIADLTLSIRLIEKDLENKKVIEEDLKTIEGDLKSLYETVHELDKSLVMVNTKSIVYIALINFIVTSLIGSTIWFLLSGGSPNA